MRGSVRGGGEAEDGGFEDEGGVDRVLRGV